MKNIDQGERVNISKYEQKNIKIFQEIFKSP